MKKKNKMFIDTDLLKDITVKKNEKSPLNKKSLIIQLAVRNNIPKETVTKILQDFFYIVSKNAKIYSHVSLYGFGIFKEKKTKHKKNDEEKKKKNSYLIFKSSFKL
jgi:nucleoid DNA-binding protein